METRQEEGRREGSTPVPETCRSMRNKKVGRSQQHSSSRSKKDRIPKFQHSTHTRKDIFKGGEVWN
jgi:hypothetical protein